MGTRFWAVRTLQVLALCFGILLAVSFAKGRAPRAALEFSAFWAAVTTAVFIPARWFQARRGQHCALCRDTPETRRSAAP